MTLRVGPGREPYYVPETLLQSLNGLPRSNDAEAAINLPDVDVETAHTIVHFLYTGQYQSLSRDEEGISTNTGAAEFKKAIAAFVAARKYGLVDLQDLAKLEVEQIGDEISVDQSAHAVGKGTLTSLQEDAGWLQDLVLRKTEQTFAESDEVFFDASFFNGIKSLKLAKVLGQRVAELYRARVRELRHQLDPFEEVLSLVAENGVEEAVEHASHELDEAATKNAPLASDGSEMANCWGSISQARDTFPQATCATAEVRMHPEEQRLANEKDTLDGCVAVTEPDTEAAVKAEEKCATAELPDDSDGADWWEAVLKTIPKPTDVVSSQREDWLQAHYIAKTGPFERMSKKERHKLRRKLRAEAEAARLLEEKTERVAGDTKEEVEVATIGGKEINVPLQVASAEELSSEVVEYVGSAADPRDTGENVEIKDSDPFAGLSKKEKKKLQQRMQKEAAAREEPTTPDVPMGSDLIEPVPDSAVDLGSSDDENCPSRSEHLAQNEQWKNCLKCQVYMRKIAIKLHTAGLPDINGLVAR